MSRSASWSGVESPVRAGDVAQVWSGHFETAVEDGLHLGQVVGTFVHRVSPLLYTVDSLLYGVEMSASTSPRPTPLSVERIVDAACLIVERDGLAGLSMRKLGAELAVDPMAVYHHVADKRQLLALVTARTIGTMSPPDPAASWDSRVRQWAMSYWELVANHRELTLAGLADPEIAAGGLPSTAPLVAAIADSGLRARTWSSRTPSSSSTPSTAPR